MTSSRAKNDVSGVARRGHADQIDDIPGPALVAYQRAEAVMDEAVPLYRLHWTLLAAVGRVLTDHGQRRAHRVDDEGEVRPGMVGKPLLARGGKRIGDTDAGMLDRDRRFDRPVGPMLLAPTDWSVVGVDGDGDRKRNPQDLDDASLALAVLLCARGEDLRTTESKRTELRRINDTPGFVRAVLAVERDYRAQMRSGMEPVAFEAPATVPTLPTLPTPPLAKPTERTPRSDRPADSGIDPGAHRADGGRPSHEIDQGDGPQLPAPQPEPEPEPTITEVTATYDAAALQIHATAVVSTGGAAPRGAVTFTLTGPGGVEVAKVPLAGGSATAQFEVREPGTYTVAAVYSRTEDHSGSQGRFVVEVAPPPSAERSTGPATEPSSEPATEPASKAAD